jgi:hypothetical protein
MSVVASVLHDDNYYERKYNEKYARIQESSSGLLDGLTTFRFSLSANTQSMILKFVLGLGLLCVTLSVIWYVCRALRRRFLNLFTPYRCTRILNLLMKAPALLPESVRTTFNDLPLSEAKLSPDHTHPLAAANRTAASDFIDRLAAVLGRTAYFIQRSRGDERNDRQGSREYYWAKDLTVAPSPLVIPRNPLVAFVDVDQYLHMESFLCASAHPTILYTFQPTSVARVAPNYSYTFDESSVVTYNVSGGGTYSHQVWNYSTDHLVVVYRTYFNIPWRTSTFLVDRRATAQDHELILLTPLGSWSRLGAILSSRWLTGRHLNRLSLVRAGSKKPSAMFQFTPTKLFLRLMSSSTTGVNISTGIPNTYAAATIPVVLDDTIASIARTSKYPLTMPTVLSFVDGDRVAASVLLEFHSYGISNKPDVVCPVAQSVRRYQFYPRIFDPVAKQSVLAFMSPLVHAGFAPDRSLGNEQACVVDRVEKFAKEDLPMSIFLSKVMREFTVLLIPDRFAHTLDPVDEDELLRRQHRPTQRRILADAEARSLSGPKRRIDMFMKAEPTSKIAPPRPISKIDGVDKRRYSKYLYAFESVLKRQSWYAFGCTPKDIAFRVSSLLIDANMASTTDFHRFDGHVSNLMRELEQICLMRAFRERYHADVSELHRGQYNLKAYATFGTQYNTLCARASGSPETSLFNTVVNAFTTFLALRMSKLDGVYLTPESAYSRLGIYGGDDGLTADVEPGILRKAALMVGQELVIKPVLRGDPGVMFLARVYSPDVWFGDVNSCCDIFRTLSKFHITARLATNVTPTMKLLEKVRCMMLSDENTPIIGEYCRGVAACLPGPIHYDAKCAEVSTWLSGWDKEFQYTNDPADWMIEYAQKSLPGFNYERFKTWLAESDTVDLLLTPPTFQEPTEAKSSVPVVIEDAILPLGVVIPVEVVRPEEKKVRDNIKISADINVLPGGRVFSALSSQSGSQTAQQSKSIANQAKFDKWANDKKIAGTWRDKPLKVRRVTPPITSTVTRPKMTPEQFEIWKAAKQRAGTWTQRPVAGVRAPAPAVS